MCEQQAELEGSWYDCGVTDCESLFPSLIHTDPLLRRYWKSGGAVGSCLSLVVCGKNRLAAGTLSPSAYPLSAAAKCRRHH